MIIGCAFPEGEQGMNVARIVTGLAGLPSSAGGATVNRFCASSLQAVNMAAQSIMLGQGESIIAGGWRACRACRWVASTPASTPG